MKSHAVPVRIEVDADLLLEAMTRPPEWEANLNPKTEAVNMGPTGFEDDESEPVAEGVEIPRVESRKQYRLMSEFAGGVDEDDVREQLALDGRGAFGRFHQVVGRYPDLAARWRQRRDEWLLGEARAWLESLGIDAALRVRAPERPPPPTRGSERRRPSVGLLELLLLGAPEGKTELLDGKVLRAFRAASGGEARAVFKNVARELCEFHGTAWHNRFIEGRNTFSTERAHLRVDGNAVELTVAVSPELWRRFEF